MRIVENTPSRLKLRDRTLWISVVCLCVAGILVARVAFDHDQSDKLIPAALSVAFGLAFLHATDVTFDKIRRTCVMSRFDVRGLARTRLVFEDIADIRVDRAVPRRLDSHLLPPMSGDGIGRYPPDGVL